MNFSLCVYALSVSVRVFLYVCLLVYLSICLSFWLSVCLPVYLSVILSLSVLSLCLSVAICLYVSPCLSVCLSMPLSQRNCQAKWEHREEDRPRNQHFKDGRVKRGGLHNAGICGGSQNYPARRAKCNVNARQNGSIAKKTGQEISTCKRCLVRVILASEF